MSGTIMAKKLFIHRRFPLLCFLFVFCIVITAVTSLTTAWVQADEPKRIATEEKAESISAAMESSLEGLPKLYKAVSKSIVRVETTDNLNVTGVIVSSDGHILVGNGFAYVNGVGSIDVKVHLSDGRTVAATAAGWSLEWRLGVFKINQEGPWPAIELGSMKGLIAGEPCPDHLEPMKQAGCTTPSTEQT